MTFYPNTSNIWSYVGIGWNTIAAPASETGTIHYTLNETDYAQITYTSPSTHTIILRVQRANDTAEVGVSIDGGPETVYDTINPFLGFGDIIVAENVPAGTHTVRATHRGPDAVHFFYLEGLKTLDNVPLHVGDNFANETSFLLAGVWNFFEDGTAFTGDITTPASARFVAGWPTGASLTVEVQKANDAGIFDVYANGVFLQTIDLYQAGAPTLSSIELDLDPDPPTGEYSIEMRHAGSNPSSSGSFLYLRRVNYIRPITNAEALAKLTSYIFRQVQVDGAIKDGFDVKAADGQFLYNMDCNSTYTCVALLALYRYNQDPRVLPAVKNYLYWLAARQTVSVDPFLDGSWTWGYKGNGAGGYVETADFYGRFGISEIRWVDAIHCVPMYVLYQYVLLSGDRATLDDLLPKFKKALDGYLTYCYDATRKLFYSSWQFKTSATKFIYDDGLRVYRGGERILERDDSFATRSNQVDYGTYVNDLFINGAARYTLVTAAYAEYTLTLETGDVVHLVTQKAYDGAIIELLVNGVLQGDIDTYSPIIETGVELGIHTAPANGTYTIRLRHSGRINAAANITPMWTRLPARYSAGQADVTLGLRAAFAMTGDTEYLDLYLGNHEVFHDFYEVGDHYGIAQYGEPPSLQTQWYPFAEGWNQFARRLLPNWPRNLHTHMEAFESYMNADKLFVLPGYEQPPEYSFNAFYLHALNSGGVGSRRADAEEGLRKGVRFGTEGVGPDGGLAFSAKYPYYYTSSAGMAVLALTGDIFHVFLGSSTHRWVPYIIYSGGGIELPFSLPQKWWSPEEGVGVGDEDESAAKIPVSYVLRYDYAVKVVCRFTDAERTAVMEFHKWVVTHRDTPFLFRFDTNLFDTEYSVYSETPSIGPRTRPERNPQDPSVWELTMVLRSSSGQRIFVPTGIV